MWLTAYESGGDFFLEGTLGAHVWRKNYGTTKPNLCTLLNESLPHITNSGDCDSSSATLVVSAVPTGGACVTEPCTVPCEHCDNFPEEVAVDLTGFSLTDNLCDACSTIPDVYVTTNTNNCINAFCVSLCSFGGGPTFYFLDIVCQVESPSANLARWLVVVSVRSISSGGCNSPLGVTIHLSWTYDSDTWEIPTEGDLLDCFTLEDENGEITLDLIASFDFGTSVCNDITGPSTIIISDASA